jgi:uncharacterized protein YndB with AHSA1/START domain
MTGITGADEHDLGQLDRAGGRAAVRFSRRLAHPPEKVWRALTEDEHLLAWFPTTIDGPREAGASLEFRFRDLELAPMQGEIVSWQPPRLLEFTWGEDLLRFELAPDGEGTLLVLTASLDEIGKVARDSAGWHMCLDQLVGELQGKPATAHDDERWYQLNRAYAGTFGADTATIGPPREWLDQQEQRH